jgi:hypothetical protein
VQIVKAIIKGMTSTTPHTVSSTPTPLATPGICATTDNVCSWYDWLKVGEKWATNPIWGSSMLK